jgi:hypothetical protein
LTMDQLPTQTAAPPCYNYDLLVVGVSFTDSRQDAGGGGTRRGNVIFSQPSPRLVMGN